MADLPDVTRVTARMRLFQYGADVERRVRQAHRRAGMELRDIVKESINRPGYQMRSQGEIGTAGRVIRKGESVNARNLEFRKNEINLDVSRSRPGEPPKRQLGGLYQSITFESIDSPRGVMTRVGPSVRVARYSRALELGYAPGGLEPRPYLAPAGRAYEGTFRQLIDRAVRGAKP